MAGKQVYVPEAQMTDGKISALACNMYSNLYTLLPCFFFRKPRINWSGSALNTFYAAIRKALVVVIVVRALGLLIGLSLAGWWIFKAD